MFNNHNHTDFSNSLLGFPDCTNKTKQLIQRAYDIGLSGISITDHEGISSHIQALNYYNNMNKDRSFVLGLGNEIYLLTEEEDFANREGADIPYYHFILLALDIEGHKQIRELSTRAWIRAYKKTGQNMWRKPTYYEDLEEIIKPNQGHVVASTACLGGRIDKMLLEQSQNVNTEVERLIGIFGKNNLYLEVQPPKDDTCDQAVVNKAMYWLGVEHGLPIIPTTDSHYLRKEDAEIHKVYLNSQDGDREVDDFYATAYLMDEDELREYLKINFTDEQIDQMYKWSDELGERIKGYDIKHDPIIPQIPKSKLPNNFCKQDDFSFWYEKYPNFAFYANEERPLHEKYFFYQIEKGLREKVKYTSKGKNIEKYIARLDEEWAELKIISEQLNTSMASYYSTMSVIIDLIWEAGSLAMPARGSAAGFLTCYLLEVTQIDPVPLGDYMPAWRHLNHQRGVELPDIDNDSESSKKLDIVNKMKEYFGEDKVLNVATFSKISAKTAIERACKGLGISNDRAGYLKSLIPVNRGNVSSLSEALYGNKENGVKAVSGMKAEFAKHPNLTECALGMEGLITNRGLHAAGVIVCNEPYTNYISAMRSSDGTLCTSYDLWDAEEAGCIKFDMLTISAADKIHKTIDYLLEHKKIEWQGSLKKTYYKYIHPDKLTYTDDKMWDILPSIYSVFQFDTPVSQKALSATHPHSTMDLSASNSLLRLMPEGADETPIDRYKRYKESYDAWVKDTVEFGLNDEERSILWHYLADSYGLAESQEKVMKLSMDERVSGYTLKEANKLRKSIAKKDKKLQAEAKKLFFDCCERQGTREVFADYVWNVLFAASMGYSFSQLHSYSYSIIALQELNLNYFYSPVYWNCACLTIESMGITDTSGGSGATDYGEVAKAIYKIKNNGLEISPPNINHSSIQFTPDEDTNSIYFGLGGISGINSEIAQQIISNRPYDSFADFYKKNSYAGSLVTNSKFVQLIKAGCFDDFSKNRVRIMKEYIMISTPKPTNLTMQNMSAIKSAMTLPKTIFAPYNFFKYVCSKPFLYGAHPKFKSKKIYWLDDKAMTYFVNNCRSSLKENVDYWEENDKTVVVDKSLEKLLSPSFDAVKEYINTKEFIESYYKATLKKKFNEMFPNQDQNHWSFESCSYYSQEHELSKVNLQDYNVECFSELPTTPIFIERSFRGRTWNQYELYAIAGTLIDRDDTHNFVTILTVDDEVVTCKMTQGVYAYYKQQLSVFDENGKKTVTDPSWLARGNLLILSGYRSDDVFICKKYTNSVFQHQVQKINRINDDGSLDIMTERNEN